MSYVNTRLQSVKKTLLQTTTFIKYNNEEVYDSHFLLNYGNDRSTSLCHELSRLAYSLSLSLFFSLSHSMIHVQSHACRRYATKIHEVGVESTSLRLVCTESRLLLSERNPVGTVDVNKRALVTIKLRVKGRRKTTATLRTRKTRIHSSGRIVRTCQKRARSDVPFALNSLFAYTAEPPRQIYEIIRPRGMLLKMMLRRAIDITLRERVIVKNSMMLTMNDLTLPR